MDEEKRQLHNIYASKTHIIMIIKVKAGTNKYEMFVRISFPQNSFDLFEKLIFYFLFE